MNTHPATPPPEKTALVLAGGGANGAVEVGFYKAIWEAGIKLDLVIGTSVGAINGAMIAAGLTPQKMHALWKRTKQQDILRFNWRLLWKGLRARSLFDERQMQRFLERGLPVRTFEELKIPFIAMTTDLVSGEAVPLDHGDLVKAVQASCALPGIFPPVWIDGQELADGGIMRLVPIDVAVSRGATTTIAALSECRSDSKEPVAGIVQVINRSFSLAISRASRTPGYLEIFSERTKLIVLEPCFTIRIEAPSILNLENTDILVKFGYEYAKARLEQAGFTFPSPSTG